MDKYYSIINTVQSYTGLLCSDCQQDIDSFMVSLGYKTVYIPNPPYTDSISRISWVNKSLSLRGGAVWFSPEEILMPSLDVYLHPTSKADTTAYCSACNLYNAGKTDEALDMLATVKVTVALAERFYENYNRIKKLRERLGLSQEKCRQLFIPAIPKVTWETWDRGTRSPSPWAEALICQRLLEEIAKKEK